MPGLRKEFIIATYKKMVEISDGKLLGEHVFRRKAGINSGYWQGRYWNSWSEFQAGMGFKPSVANARIPNDVLLRRYAELALELGKLPTHIDMIVKHKADRTFPDSSTFWHLGTKEHRLARLAAFCEGKPEFAMVLEYVRRDREKAERLRKQRPSKNVQGIVYLARQGSGYKIGRIHASGRRHSVECVLLARRPDTVHAIDTDDPAGIERYWRFRFRLRRQGSTNCFNLSDQDLRAFRRRRFQ